LRQAVRLYAKKNNLHRPHFRKGAGDLGPRNKIPLATLHLHSVLLHGVKVWAAGEKGDIESGLGHTRPDIGSNGPGARDQKSHGRSSPSAAATARRRIFPVAVVGILSTR